MSSAYQGPHRALLIYFHDSHLTAAIQRLRKSMLSLGWEVVPCLLSNTNSQQAQQDLQTGVDALINGVGYPEQGLVVVYGGCGMLVNKQVPVVDESGEGFEWKEWRWHAMPTNPSNVSEKSYICSTHAALVDPEPMLKRLHASRHNEILFILDTPGDLTKTHFNKWKQTTQPPDSKRNVQVIHLREEWTSETNIATCTAPPGQGEIPCQRAALQIPEDFGDARLQMMAWCLEGAAKQMEVGEQFYLIETYADTSSALGARGAERFDVWGEPEDLEFMRGLRQLPVGERRGGGVGGMRESAEWM